MTKKATARGSRRHPGRGRGRVGLPAGPPDQRCRAARGRGGALCGALVAAGQDPVRLARRAHPRGDGAAYLIDCAAAQAADLAKRLGFYRLRAKVAIADESADRGVVAGWGEELENAAGGVVYAIRAPALG